MRLKERTLISVRLHPRRRSVGAMGGLKEDFNPEGLSLRASLLPGEGEIACGERGIVNRNRMQLLVPRDAQAMPGDGVFLDGRMYRILSVKRWWGHLELECEAIA